MKNVRVILSPEAEEVYKKLNSEAEANKQSRMILKAVNNKIELIVKYCDGECEIKTLNKENHSYSIN